MKEPKPFTLTKAAIRRLEQVKQQITEEPRRINMFLWRMKFRKSQSNTATVPPCGTVACIAGWLVHNSGARDVPGHTDRLAMRLLGLDPEKESDGAIAEDLFFPGNWGYKLANSYRNAKENFNKEKEAKIVCTRIDQFIEKYSRPKV